MHSTFTDTAPCKELQSIFTLHLPAVSSTFLSLRNFRL